MISCTRTASAPPGGLNGVLDLSSWPGRGTVSLAGVWEVYDGVLLEPDRILGRPHTERRYQEIPDQGAGSRQAHAGLLRATYRLLVRTGRPKTIYLVSLPKIYGAVKVWANREPVLSLGAVDAGPPRTRVAAGITALVRTDENGVVDLVIQEAVTGLFPCGLINEAPGISPYQAAGGLVGTARAAADWLLLGALSFMLVHNFFYFLNRRQDVFLLWFSLFCLFLVLRIGITGGSQVLTTLLGPSPEGFLRLQGLTVYPLPPLLALFLSSFHKYARGRLLSLGITALSAGFLALSLLLPLTLWYGLLHWYYRLLLAGLVGIIAAQVWPTKDEEALLPRLAPVLLTATAVLAEYSLRVFRPWQEDPFAYGWLVYAALLALGIGKRSSDSHNQLVILSRQRDRQKQELEELVAERTKALKAANERLRALAETDGLTGLANRRSFDEILLREWRRHLRTERPLALVVADVDHFKAYNDYYGHIAGDACLRRLAEVLKEHARRPGDMVARFGGEEFVFLLPETALPGAERIARSVVEAVSNLAIEHAGSNHKRVTLSMGVSSMIPMGDYAPETLFHAADVALYGVKHRGRNGVGLGQIPS